MDKSLGSVEVGTVYRMLASLPDDTKDISFEFIVGSLFPDAFTNMQDLLKEAHMMGYKQAKEETNV